MYNHVVNVTIFFLDAIQTEDPGQLRAVLDTNIRLLVADKVGTPSTDLWGFCIGGDFIPVQIITKLHDLFESGKFSALRFFSCAPVRPIWGRSWRHCCRLQVNVPP
jgi:hypothetical protein